jgi:AcrR family transcriptional regulator
MPAARQGRDDVVAQIFTLIRDRGLDGTSLADIAATTGLGKSSLYHYFPGGKDHMAEAVLDHAGRWMQAHALAALRAPGAPAKRLRAMLRTLDDLYAGGTVACVLGALALGTGRERLAGRLAGVFTGWIDALRDLAVEVGVRPAEARERAEDAVVRIEGALVLAVSLGDPAPFARACRRIERDLLRVPESSESLPVKAARNCSSA